MAPLIVLLVAFVVSGLVLRAVKRRDVVAPAGRIAAAVMFTFTGVSHFIFPEAMAEMVPPMFPRPQFWVVLTGIAEILGGVGLLVPRFSGKAAWGLVLLLIGVLPANVYAAVHQVGMGGHLDGAGYLWFRIPLQLLFLAWVIRFGIVANRRAGEAGTT